MQQKKRLACVIRSSPYHQYRGEEALDFILSASAFTDDIQVIFMHNGVFQLLPCQMPEKILQKHYTAGFAALSDFGITAVYLEKTSLLTRQLTLDALVIKPILVSITEIKTLLQTCSAGVFHF